MLDELNKEKKYKKIWEKCMKKFTNYNYSTEPSYVSEDWSRFMMELPHYHTYFACGWKWNT